MNQITEMLKGVLEGMLRLEKSLQNLAPLENGIV